MKLTTTILTTFLLLFFITTTSTAQLTVNSDITTDTVWGISDSPVTVAETVSISEGSTLSIEPGVTVLMGAGTSLLVDGTLVADGTDSDRVFFTSSSETAGSWGSIEFRNSSDAGSVINYVTIEYGAGESRSGMVFFTTGAFPVSVSNSTFRNSAIHGINLRASSSTISNSEFYDNAGFGVFADLSLDFTVNQSLIYRNTQGGVRVPLNSQAVINESVIDTNGVGILIENNGRPEITNSDIRANDTGIRILEVGSSQPLIRDNVIAGNSNWGIGSLGGNVLDARFNFWGSPFGPTVNTNPTGEGDNITTNIDYTPWRDGSGMDLPVITVDSNIGTDTTWETGNVYLITTNITVTSGNTLTIEPGTIVKFESGRSMTISGTLSASGTSESLITFTSYRDDSAGGDSNGDGDSTTPGPGDWSRMIVESTGSSISHAIIRYGSSNSNSGILELYSGITLSNLFVNNNSGNGIYSEVSQSGWTNIKSISNSNHGIYFRETSLQMNESETSLNGSHGLYVLSDDVNLPIQLDNFRSADNGSSGIYINGSNSSRNGARIDELLNSEIIGNGESGLYLEFSDSGPQLFSGNTISNNSDHGISLHHGLDTEDVVFENNIISGNGQSGIRANSARFIDNSFDNNRFPIGTWQNLGLSYIDDSDQDLNTFSENTYRAIALYAESLRDTLSAIVPEAFDNNPVYIIATTGTANSSSHTLTIDPGVTIKTSSQLVNNSIPFQLRGKLIAKGTEQDPIVFTSLYDEDFGPGVAPDETSTPSSDDWGGLYLDGDGTVDSEVSYLYLRFGRTNLEMGTSSSSQVEYSNTFSNVWVDNARDYGIFLEESFAEFDGLRATDNGRHGVRIRDRRSNGFITNVEIRNSTITGNGGNNDSYAGLYAQSSDDGATFGVVTFSTIDGNANGIIIENASDVTTIGANTISNNAHHGVTLVSDRAREDISYFGNNVSDNGQTGILSSKAVFIDNTFARNRFGIGTWNRSGHRYVDENGADNNQFQDNEFNNAIALYNRSLRDTLSAVVPEAFDNNPVYIIATTGTANSSSHTLTIDPGVTIKTSSQLVNNSIPFQLRGKLIAKGTEQDPIVFTSLYDEDFGPGVAPDETSTPSSDDWGGLYLDGDGTVDSEVSYLYLRFGRTNLEMGTSSSSQVEYSNTFSNVWVDNARDYGIFLEESFAEFDGLRATDNGRHGVRIRDRRSNGFITNVEIRNSTITGNGGNNDSYAGLYAQSGDDGAAFREISNTTIEDNSQGVMIEASGVPSSFQFNEVRGNAHNGIYARMLETPSDSALTVSGNTFADHQNGTGLISTRAIIEDNIFENNELPIAVMEYLSKDGTSNENGNFYEGNTFDEHTYQDAIGIYSSSSHSLKGNLGHSWPADFVNPVLIPLQGTTYINSEDSVNVAPGTVIKMGRNGSNDSFRIQGKMIAEGLSDSKIIFTSLTDDTYGGDTNRDSTDTVPARNNWDNLDIDGSSSSGTRFKHVIARYGDTNFRFDNGTEAIIDSSFISNARYGIYSDDGSKPTVRNTDIHSNQYGLRVQGDSDDPNIHLNNFYNNDEAALYAFRDVTATNNYWGDSTGPFVDQGSNTDPNLGGQGNQILVNGSNRVEYEPWQVSRSGVLLGDVSENGAVSAFDATLILQHIVGDIVLSSGQLTAADVTGNGDVNAFDASNILQFVVGAISGFPGAGKAPVIEPEELFELTTDVTDTYFDVKIRSKGALPFYAGQMSLEYDDSRFSSSELLSTAATTEWSSRMKAEDGIAKAAAAGVNPVEAAGELLHLRFEFNEEFAGSPGSFNINSLILNEIDVTEAANHIATSTVKDLEVPDTFALEQNYPNPFNPSTKIQYQLPESGEVTVRVFNAIGQQVAVLANQLRKQAGVYTINWDAGSAASGVYFYRIEVRGDNGSNFMDVKKMTLIK